MSSPRGSIDEEPEIKYAIQRIKADYGVNVLVSSKLKPLLKFGRNPNVGAAATGYTIWYTGQDQANETYVATNVNSIDSISSSSTAVLGSVMIEGHTQSSGNRTFVVQSATLQGQTRVALTTALNRCSRVYNDSTSTWDGGVYAYENTTITAGKPVDTTKIHVSVAANKNQSEKASTSLSSSDYWIVTGFRGDILEKANATADVELQVRLNGKVFRPVEDVSCSNSHNGEFQFKPYLIVPPNSDVRLVAASDSTSRDVSGSIQGYLAKIVDKI